MERTETIYFSKPDTSLLTKILGNEFEEIIYEFSNVSDKDVKRLDKLIRRNYFHFGILGKRTKGEDTIRYTRGGKSSVFLYKDKDNKVTISHHYPDCTLDKILSSINKDKGKITIGD